MDPRDDTPDVRGQYFFHRDPAGIDEQGKVSEVLGEGPNLVWAAHRYRIMNWRR